MTFNGDNVQAVISQKQLGLLLDSKLDPDEHINNKINKCNKIIGIMKKLSLFLSRKTLLTIYKLFLRPNLYYADIIFENPCNESFKTEINTGQLLLLLGRLNTHHVIVFIKN